MLLSCVVVVIASMFDLTEGFEEVEAEEEGDDDDDDADADEGEGDVDKFCWFSSFD